MGLASKGWVTAALGISLYTPAPGAQLYVDAVEPYFFWRSGEPQGMFYELVQAVASRAGQTVSIQPVPVARELVLINRSQDAVGVVARMPERERSYTWLCLILREEVVLITGAASPVNISSIAAARDLRLGVLRGSPSDSAARALGFTQIETASRPEDNARKLAMGRIDALIAIRHVAAHGQQNAGLKPEALRYGAVVGHVEFYLAGPPQLQETEARRWKQACKQVRDDGSFARMAHKYRPAAPRWKSR